MLQDVRSTVQQASALRAYLEGREQLERDYSERLALLAAELPTEPSCALSASLGAVAEQLRDGGNQVAANHAELASRLQGAALDGLLPVAESAEAEMAAVAEAAEGTRDALREAYVAMDETQTVYIAKELEAAAAEERADSVPGQEQERLGRLRANAARIRAEAAEATAGYRAAIREANELQAHKDDIRIPAVLKDSKFLLLILKFSTLQATSQVKST